MENLIKEIKNLGNDGAVMFKLKDGKVTHISPLLQVTSINEMLQQLSDLRDAIDHFIKDVVDKNLPKN